NSHPDDIRIDTWLGTPERFFVARSSRDLKRIDLLAVKVNGAVTTLVEERANTYLDIQQPVLVNNGQEFVFWSERDGWGHYYLYDGSGNLKNQVTSGEFYCSEVAGFDEKARVLYFQANGREANEDPYYRHLYRINLDGSHMALLNPGNFDHQSAMEENERFFVNNSSRVNTVPESALYNNAGQVILQLETADLSQLFAAGYQFPEPFQVKADD